MITKAIKKAFEQRDRYGWDKLFWAVDLHDTIIPGSYTKNNDGKQLYEGAQEVLECLSNKDDMILILYTSSHPEAIINILDWLEGMGIFFDYVNCNPHCNPNTICNFSQKFYFNILIDDKAGFVGETDWLLIRDQLIDIGYMDEDKI